MQSSKWRNVDAAPESPATYQDIGRQDSILHKQASPTHPLDHLEGQREATLGAMPREWNDTEKSLLNLPNTGHRQLKELIEGLRLRLDDLRDQGERIEALGNSAKELLRSFGAEDARFRSEFKVQIENLERFKEEKVSVEAMHGRLQAEKEKIEGYERRIEKVKTKIERHNEMESGKKRVSWRTRLFWGCTALLVILWLLATTGSDGDDISYTAAASESIKLVPPVLHAEVEHDLDSLFLG